MLKSALRIIGLLPILVICSWAGGCKYYVPVGAPRPSAPPPQDRARVFFVKPEGSGEGNATFLLKETKLIGCLETHKAMYVDLPPGEHFFMSVASNVDGVLADLEGGRTYYIELISTAGEGTALGGTTERMALTPLVPGDEQWERRHEWVENAELVTLDKDRGAKWEARKAAKIRERFERFRRGEQRYALLKRHHGE